MILFSLFLHAFHTFRPRFWVFEFFLGFFKIDEIFVKFLGWVLLKWSYMLMRCITFAFLTMFHAIWCVFVVTLCAGRFGLGWTDDDILVTRHMIMHFSCIRTILFSFWYNCWLELFFCSSLSLSLPLSNSLHMAPKCKSALSQNPLCSGASSSSDFTPLHVRFCDLKAC